MKNNRCTVFVFAAFAGAILFCQQAVGKEELPYYRRVNTTIHGSVRFVKTTHYASVDSTKSLTEADVTKIDVEEYDRNGYLKVSTSYNMTTFAISKETYDQNKEQGIYVTSRYTQDGKLISRGAYNEDKKGNLIEVTSTDGTTTFISKKYEYDKRGNLLQEYDFNQNGSLNLRYLNEYDKNNKRKSQSGFRAQNELFFKTAWRYNDKGQIIETITTSFGKTKTQQYVKMIQYHEKNRIVEEKYSSNAGISYYKTVYDKKGNISEIHSENRVLNTQRIFSRNKRGDIVQIRVFSRNVLTVLTQYLFDRWDNWIEKAEYDVLNQKKTVVKREIEYYH